MKSNDIKETALNFLTHHEQLTAVIGSCPPDGNTHVATVYYYVNSDFNFYFLTATNTQKYLNLMKNPNAGIVVGFGPSQTTIQGQGAAQLLEKDSKEENEAIVLIKNRLQKHGNETWPIFQLEAYENQSIAVFRFIPQKLQLLNLEDDNGLSVTTTNVLQII